MHSVIKIIYYSKTYKDIPRCLIFIKRFLEGSRELCRYFTLKRELKLG